MRIEIAFYKGTDELLDRTIQWWTKGPYSHCEIVIGGLAYSSSPRDGGVRVKSGIDFASGNWDLLSIDADKAQVLTWFAAHEGMKYDYLAILGFIIPLQLGQTRRLFCSEACGSSLGIVDSWGYHPSSLCAYLLRTPRFNARRGPMAREALIS